MMHGHINIKPTLIHKNLGKIMQFVEVSYIAVKKKTCYEACMGTVGHTQFVSNNTHKILSHAATK